MKEKFLTLVYLAYALVCVSGCSYRAWYEGIQETERRKCYRIENQIERQECLDRLREMSYDQYQKEREIEEK